MSYILDDNLPEIKPCPFCGRDPAVQVDKRYPKNLESLMPVDAYTVVCNTFSCPIYHADNTWFTKAETAIQWWNERKEEPAGVVRCRDCKHWIGGGIDDKDNFIPPRCTLFNEPQTSNWFCPEGERKSDEQTD